MAKFIAKCVFYARNFVIGLAVIATILLFSIDYNKSESHLALALLLITAALWLIAYLLDKLFPKAKKFFNVH